MGIAGERYKVPIAVMCLLETPYNEKGQAEARPFAL
jgi:hypothetical protein